MLSSEEEGGNAFLLLGSRATQMCSLTRRTPQRCAAPDVLWMLKQHHSWSGYPDISDYRLF